MDRGRYGNLEINMTDVSLLVKRVSDLETRVAVSDKGGESIDKRLDAIEDSIKWLTRLILGAMILALIGFMLRGGISLV